MAFPRLAVIGCGAVASERHLPALVDLGWRPCVLVDPCVERASALAQRYKVGRVAQHVSDLEQEGVEAALVATNAASHARVALPLLNRGVHVFVEKPLATSIGDARAMCNAAASSPAAVLAVGHMRRFLFVNRWVKMLIERGALGAIESFDVREGECFHRRQASDNPRASVGTGQFSPAFWDRKMSGGGVLLDTGSHTLDTLAWWLGRGAGKVVGYRDDSLGGVESDAILELEFPGSAAGSVELSRTRTLRNTAILTGSRCRIEVALHRNEIIGIAPDSHLAKELDGRNGAAMPNESLYDDMFRRELDDWLGAIRGTSVPFVDGASAAPGIDVIDQCYRMRQPLRPRRAGGGSTAAKGGGLKDRTVLVTGASGFIGGRLTERLAIEEGAQVRAAVRTFQNAARVSRFSEDRVEVRRFDMTGKAGKDAIGDLVKGCDAVFHLAHDADSPRANAEGARLIGTACRSAGVRRLVFVSSMSVYEPLPDAPLTEASAIGRHRRNNKLAAEREITRMIREEGLQATVMQPTIVYGPFSRWWTDQPVEALIDGTLILPAPGDGICNAVYVDDVISALILAARRDAAQGETLLISGPGHPTWRDFFGGYARAIGRDDALRMMARDEIERRNAQGAGSPTLLALKRLLTQPPLRRALHFVYGRLGDSVKANAKRFYKQGLAPLLGDTEGTTEFLPPKRRLDLYAAKCAVRIDKARQILGYEPEFDLERGMDATTRYVRWAYGHRLQGKLPTV